MQLETIFVEKFDSLFDNYLFENLFLGSKLSNRICEIVEMDMDSLRTILGTRLRKCADAVKLIRLPNESGDGLSRSNLLQSLDSALLESLQVELSVSQVKQLFKNKFSS
jgi:hypothetical protein